MLRKLMNGLVLLAVAGLLVALLRQFNWDPFAAGAWALGKIWDTINHVADLWSNNKTFRHVTKAPK